jgi:lipid-A-disaccharide synthase-like uncharacterized protein
MHPGWFHGTGLELGLQLFFALTIAHALGDYPLQTDFMARGKNRHVVQSYVDLPARTLWLYCLSAHALVHGALVWLITGCVGLGAVEFVLHWLIDWAKLERKISFHTDQLLHLVCKLGYVLILVWKFEV